MTRHIITGVAAAVDSARQSGPKPDTNLWLDASDVPRALRHISKLTGERYPNVEVFTTDELEDRVCLELV